MTYGNYIYQDNTQQSRQAAIDQLINTADILEKGHLKAVETASQLQTAIGQLDFNEKEDDFKQELLNDVQQTIDDNVKYGNMYYALDDIIAKSGKIMSDPRVLGRLRAQQDYKAWENKLNARTDISEDKKDWMRDLNKYYYEDKLDDKGNVIGGTKWTPIKEIGKDFDYGSLLIKAIHQVAAKQIRSGERIEYLDQYGKPIDISTDPNGVASAWIKKEDGSYREQLKAKDIQGALDTLIATTPGAMTGLKEDYEFANWYHKKHKDDEGYSDPYGITVNGVVLSPEDYKKRRFNQGIDAASYLNIKTATDQSIIYNPQLSVDSNSGAKSGGGHNDNSILNSGISSLGVPTQYRINIDTNTKNKMDESVNAVKEIATKYNLPGYVFNNENPERSFENAMRKVLTEQVKGSLTPEQASEAIEGIRRAQEDYSLAKSNNNAIRNSAIAGLTGKDAKKYDDAMSFIRDFSSGTLDITNQYYKKFINEFDNLYEDSNGNKTQNVEIEFPIEQAQKLKQWIEDSDENVSNYDKYNISFNGNKLTVPKNIQAALFVSKMIKDVGTSGLPTTWYNSPNSNDAKAYMKFMNMGDVLKEATDFADKQNKKIDEQGVEVRSQSYLLPGLDWTNVQETGLPVKDAKALYDYTITKLKNIGLDLSQFTVYSFDKEDKDQYGNLVKYNKTDVRDLRNSFAKAQETGHLQISPMIHNVEGVGSYLQFPEYIKGEATGKYITCFVVDATKSEESRRWKEHPDVIATQSVGKILDMPGQSDYAIRESTMPILGEILMTGEKNNIVKLTWKGNSYNTDITSARILKSYGIQMEEFKRKFKNNELDEKGLSYLNQFLIKAANHISNITNYSADLIYNDMLKDFGLTN